ncbi:Mediator complex subunit 6 [Intoshia linei]|uniref:Mediator complex subunit 6 n=1 Tax=Intoshia linei TaxID=1819745 RepID=A0A177BAU2_9BILA|nr:Mediator complex subunit 6 [Intoshia linei]
MNNLEISLNNCRSVRLKLRYNHQPSTTGIGNYLSKYGEVHGIIIHQNEEYKASVYMKNVHHADDIIPRINNEQLMGQSITASNFKPQNLVRIYVHKRIHRMSVIRFAASFGVLQSVDEEPTHRFDRISYLISFEVKNKQLSFYDRIHCNNVYAYDSHIPVMAEIVPNFENSSVCDSDFVIKTVDHNEDIVVTWHTLFDKYQRLNQNLQVEFLKETDNLKTFISNQNEDQIRLEKKKLSISWSDSSWPHVLSKYNVMDYFSQLSNPFYDKTCNNQILKMQRLEANNLVNMIGLEYMCVFDQEPILFIIRKQYRKSPHEIQSISSYYICAGTVYESPDLMTLYISRLITASYNLRKAFEEVQNYSKYDDDTIEKEKNKTKNVGSYFMRKRTDVILTNLSHIFPMDQDKNQENVHNN